MKAIGLKIDKAVIAYDPNGSGPGQHGGNVDVKSGDTLAWQCENNGHSFLVRFYRFGTTESIWPFAEPAEHSDADPTIDYLRVESTTPKTRTVNTGETLKYEVKVERGPTAVPLDPTIIIRPGLRSIVAAGLPWAVAGAAVGAAVTAFVSG